MPIHQLPWSAFHSDAWVAGVLLVFSVASLIKIRSQQPWSYFAIGIAIISLVPVLQLASGQIKLLGTAWLSSLYLLGFLLAILTGARWQCARINELADALFLAVAVAAPLSVGLQLCQWLSVTEGCLCGASWASPVGTDFRKAANLGQPNQLSTLLLVAIVAFTWAWVRQTLSGSVVVFVTFFILIGLALTESRTGVLAISVMFLFAWYWRRLWPSRRAPYVATLLYIFFLSMFLAQSHVTQWLQLGDTSSLIVRVKNESRLEIWALFLSAAAERPWLGYGWNQSAIAQVLFANDGTASTGSNVVATSYAHNLFIDLLLWLGIPIGISVSLALVGWLVQCIRHVRENLDALLVLCVVAMGVHAMLELPLYYAYFLLPLGLVIGMLGVRLNISAAFATSLRPVVCIWIVCSALYLAVVRDYFLLEQSYEELRLNTARIIGENTQTPPDVFVLTQLQDLITVSRLEPKTGMSAVEVNLVTKVALVYPGEHYLLKLAAILTLNGQESKASYWLYKLCNLHGRESCDKGQLEWARLINQFPQLKQVEWPGNPVLQTNP